MYHDFTRITDLTQKIFNKFGFSYKENDELILKISWKGRNTQTYMRYDTCRFLAQTSGV